ncbi:MAG: hypothetical protein WA949_23595 [Phormidesmis sp.]
MASIQVTISLPEDVYHRAQRFSRLINRDLASVLADTVGSSLPPLSDQVESLPEIDELSDRAILDLAGSKLSTQQDQRLSALLEKQREGELLGDDPQELEALMQVYNEGWLRKTAGLVEAVKRGLMSPMDS